MNNALIKTNKIKNYNYEDYFRFKDKLKDRNFNNITNNCCNIYEDDDNY